MKVLYEATVAGNAFREQKYKGGVFRVVDSLLEELFNRKDINTFITSLEYTTAKKDLLLYVQHKGESELRLYSYWENLKTEISAIENQVASQVSDMHKKSFFARQLLFGQKKALKETLNRMENLKSLPQIEDAKFDIFHSPYYAIPHTVSANKSLKTFWTSYDLIPVLFPQLFEQGTINEVRSALDQLTRDTWVVCISNSTRNDLLNFLGQKIDENKVTVTPLAASKDFYQEKDKEKISKVLKSYAVPAEIPYVLSLCTLEPRKNIINTIKAFSRLVREEKIMDLNLVLAGARGWKFDSIFQEIETNEVVKSKIFVTGYVQDQDLACLYSGAKMFVYPSLYEGFGLPPLEAMQSGTPVIASNNSSLPEVIGDAGIMVDAGDLDSLVSEMLGLYKDQGKCNHLTELALKRAAGFTWENTCDLTIRSYKRAL